MRHTNRITALEQGKSVIQQEIHALSMLCENLNDTFSQCAELIVNTSGRIAVSGVGKSGHIGRKIAATFASTGTPAFFVHPTEAAHGDLGMILPDDILLVISNSGNTLELAALLNYATHAGMLVIAITQESQSALGKLADLCLVLPHIPEACPLGCAPTSSTTCTLALGDALAITVLQLRGFNAKDFSIYHPGGTLGKQLRSVSEVMHTGEALPIVHMQAPMSDVLIEMTAKSLGCAGVIDSNGDLVGIITDGDLRRNMTNDIMQKMALDIMTKKPITINNDCLLSKATYLLRSKAITGVFIVENKKAIGFLHLHDCK